MCERCAGEFNLGGCGWTVVNLEESKKEEGYIPRVQEFASTNVLTRIHEKRIEAEKAHNPRYGSSLAVVGAMDAAIGFVREKNQAPRALDGKRMEGKTSGELSSLKENLSSEIHRSVTIL